MPLWPAEQIPEIYPPGTAKKILDEIKAIEDTINEALKDIPKSANKETKLAALNKALVKHRVKAHCDYQDNILVFVASSIAPELDQYIYVY